MNISKSISDIGWMYMAPPLRKKQIMQVPPISGIPIIGLQPDRPKTPPPCIFKSTDTKYQTLCKEGGHSNLLRFRENKFPDNAAAVPYPKSEWFYLEDIRSQEHAHQIKVNENRTPYHAKVPSYMIWGNIPNQRLLPRTRPWAPPRDRKYTESSKDCSQGKSLGALKARKKPAITTAAEDIAHTIKRINKEKPDLNKLLAHGYVQDYEMIRKECHNKQLEQAVIRAKEREQARKTDQFAARRMGTKGYGGKAKKVNQVIGGW